MKLRIRGNSVRVRVSKTELAEIKPQDAVAAELRGAVLKISVPEKEVERWLRPEEVSIEAEQAVGDGVVLRVLVEKENGGAPLTRRVPLARRLY